MKKNKKIENHCECEFNYREKTNDVLIHILNQAIKPNNTAGDLFL